MNGCAFCAVLHPDDARDSGETDDRLVALPVWRDVPWFIERERVALEWTERLTDIARREVDDALYARAQAEFGERGLVELTLAGAAINAWNRLNVPFRRTPDITFRTRQAVSQPT